MQINGRTAGELEVAGEAEGFVERERLGVGHKRRDCFDQEACLVAQVAQPA